MMETEEWTFETVGFKIAMVGWGQRWKPGALLLHGHGDSAVTFAPLVSLLPDSYHYVSFDFPGHGKSDFLPACPVPTHSLFLEIIRQVVLHLGWKTYICIGHSMGGVLAMLHHHLHPGQLRKLVCLDPLYGILRYTGMTDHNSKFVNMMFYEQYYDNCYAVSQPKISTYEDAMDSIMSLRKLTREKAELVMSRNLTRVKGGLYKVSPQKAAFQLAHIPVTYDILEHIFTNITLPILIFHTSHVVALYNQAQFSSKSVKLFDDKSTKYKVVFIEGSHDQHFFKPEEFVSHILEFLDCVQSKM